jgi:hypothetical protein
MKREDDGYEQMMRVENPYAVADDADLDASRRAEATYGALGTGSVADFEPHHEERQPE